MTAAGLPWFESSRENIARGWRAMWWPTVHFLGGEAWADALRTEPARAAKRMDHYGSPSLS